MNNSTYQVSVFISLLKNGWHITLSIIILTTTENCAQSDNYWSWNFNTPSTLLAGSVVGGGAGPSSIFYNPALIDHEDTPSISLSASIVSLQLFKFENISGELNDKEIDCIEYKNAKKETKLNENKLAKKLLSKNRNAKNIVIKKNEIKKIEEAKMVLSNKAQIILNKELNKAKKRLTKLEEDKIKIEKEQIIIEENLENSEEKQANILRKSSRVQELINANYDVIDTRRKAYIDALRINSANIFRNIADEFRALYDNYRDDHFYLRLLSRSSGLISTNNKNELNIKLWLSGSLQKYIIDKMTLLTNEITAQLNSRKIKLRNVKIELINGTILS